ncbi:hypothetical protein LCGC14_0219650 [marine sediment metagenome]|uniref:GDP-mannose 4,6-dehydratase n=1 Tax=marine sediment metagenome TaxID=412755 RepID=A0A0F9UD36_9ZZZZ
MDKIALITGTTGQDGSYLSELLLEKDYRVYGLIRRSSVNTTERIVHFQNHPNFKLVEGDITDFSCMHRLISGIQPDEIYNLAAMSHVGVSFDQPITTCQINAVGPLNMLESIRQSSPHSKFYQACHDTETKVVTVDGIKSYDKICVGDRVYTLNESTGCVEIKRVVKKLIYDYDGKMVSLKGRRINQLVTPNHSVLLRNDDGCIVREQASNVASLFPYSRTSKYSIPMTSNHFSESYVSTVKLSELANNNFADNCSVNLIDEINAECFYYLLGLYIGDGYFASSSKRKVKFVRNTLSGKMGTTRNKSFDGKFVAENMDRDIESGGKSSYILFAVPEPDKARNKLLKCLNKLGLDFRAKDITIELSCSALASVFRLCGTKCKYKSIPDFVFSIPISLQQRVFEGLIDSDGYRRGGGVTQYFTTTSDQLAVDFIRLCANVGKNCSYNYATPNVTQICGHDVTPSKSYAFTIAGKSTNKLYTKNISRVPYRGKVWCLSMEDNHNFLISRKGKLAFSGNSTSELFGETDIAPQCETTPMVPNSPYAVAKLYAHQLVGLYRRAYGIFACAGILFNHECISTNTPIFIKRHGMIDIIPAGDLHNFDTETNKPQTFETRDTYIWDQDGWTKIKWTTVTKTDEQNSDHRMICINSRGGSFNATAHHKALDENGQDIRVDHLKKGSLVSLVETMPRETSDTIIISENLTPEFAELLGYLVGDGYVSIDRQVQFTNNDKNIRDRVAYLWKTIYNGTHRTYCCESGFGGKSTQLYLGGINKEQRVKLRNLIYSGNKKRVPSIILNLSKVWKDFIDAYYQCDGLKSPVTRCTYLYQSFKTNSSILASGLIYIINQLTGQSFNINTYFNRDVLTYHVNFHSPNDTGKGLHLRRLTNEVTKIIELPREDYVLDIETESGTFNCGVGMSHVHNSERRGEAFVTRKITKYVAMLQNWMDVNSGFPRIDVDVLPLALGNIEAKRDWSHAEDMVRGMWLMMQHSKADDYVLGSGETHTVKEFLQLAFDSIGLDYSDYVIIDPAFYRPVDVNLLHADPSKAKTVLGWESTICFGELIDRMIQSDYKALVECPV